MSTTQKEVFTALVEALVQSNRFMEQFIAESPELCAQFEENEDLIHMVEPDLDELPEGVVLTDGVLRCEVIYTKDVVKVDEFPNIAEGVNFANELYLKN